MIYKKGEYKIDILFDKYQIIKPLSVKQSTQVFLAEHIKLKAFRVIKIIHKNHLLYEAFLNEAYILKNLKHPCIPLIYDIEEDEQSTYIVEEYIEGQSLTNYRLNQSQISQEVIIRFGIQICQLIEYLHSQAPSPILHLDIKPDNIMLSDCILKLVDFGTATYKKDISNRKYLLGTKGYAPPEQYNQLEIDERSDIYSIGMLLYFLVTGNLFKDNLRISHIDQFVNCSKELKNIIKRCLKYDPLQRYYQVNRLRNKLSAILPKSNQVDKSNQTKESNKSLIISVAGSQNRVGTTHISFSLAFYLTKVGYNCIYIESNQSEHIKSIADYHQLIQKDNGIYNFNQCDIILSDFVDNIDICEKYEFVIKDFGVINEENKEEFSHSDVCIVVLGIKEWELDYAEECVHLFAKDSNIIYLFNYIDDAAYRTAAKNMCKKHCYRVPYEPNYKKLNSYTTEMFDELLKDVITIKRKGGYKINIINILKNNYEKTINSYEKIK